MIDSFVNIYFFFLILSNIIFSLLFLLFMLKKCQQRSKRNFLRSLLFLLVGVVMLCFYRSETLGPWAALGITGALMILCVYLAEMAGKKMQ